MSALQGCRVLDLGIITAGAATAAMLADFGAEVIKVESPSYRDPFRRWLSERPVNAATDLPPFFAATNRGKQGVSLDLKSPRGREVFLELAAHADVVLENFRRGVMQKLGIGFEVLKACNPDIILASISSQGETGPESAYVSYGSTLEAVAGLAWTSGYADAGPTVSGVDLNYPDQVVALFASSMILAAWRARQRGSGGIHLDLSQRELTSYLIGESFAAAGAGIDVARSGNAQPPYALQECIQGSDGRWFALSATEAQLDALRAVAGGLPAGGDLHAGLAHWASARAPAEAVQALQARGIAAAEVLRGVDVYAREGGVWTHALQRSPSGVIVKGFPVQFERAPLRIVRDAPGIGADTEQVLREVARLSPEQIRSLAEEGIIELAAGEPTPVASHV